MKLQIQRDKDTNFSMYGASIIVDNKNIGSVDNGQTETFTCPNDATSLIIRSGPYISETIDLAKLGQQDITLSIGPKTKFSGGAILGAGVASVTLSGLFNIRGLLAALVLILIWDVTVLRKKWHVTIDDIFDQ